MSFLCPKCGCDKNSGSRCPESRQPCPFDQPSAYREEQATMKATADKSVFSRMNAEATLRFPAPITIDQWDRFCLANGLDYAPQLGKRNVYVGYGSEIILGQVGSVKDGESSPPQSFTSLLVRYSEGDIRTERMILVLCDRFNAIDKAEFIERHTAKLSAEIKEALSEHTTNRAGADPAAVQASLSRVMDSIMDKHQVRDVRVGEAKEIHVTWKDLYPSFWSRLRAQFAYNVLRLGIERTGSPSRFLSFLGYKETMVPIVDEERLAEIRTTLSDEAEIHVAAIQQGAIKILYGSTLAIPYSHMEVEVFVEPKMPINHITMTVTVGDTETL